jgi:hypothetical protein
VYNYHNNRAYGYKRFGILTRLVGIGCFGLDRYKSW